MAGESKCNECGMQVRLGEYHPFAACLMFKGCHNSTVVRANIQAITSEWQAIGRRASDHECKHSHGGK